MGVPPETSKSGLWHRSGRRWSSGDDLEIILAPKMEPFESHFHFGAMLDFFVRCLGSQIQPYLEHVSEAMLVGLWGLIGHQIPLKRMRGPSNMQFSPSFVATYLWDAF